MVDSVPKNMTKKEREQYEKKQEAERIAAEEERIKKEQKKAQKKEEIPKVDLKAIKKEQAKQLAVEKEAKRQAKRVSEQQSEFKQKLQDSKYFVIGFLILCVLCYIKYKEEKIAKYSKYDMTTQDGFKDYYEILEIDRSATLKQIKSQYKKLATLWHPDKNADCGEECEKKFEKIGTAFEILGNEETRKVYDETSSVVEKIQSVAVELTIQNFDKLVNDQTDVWIIQIYEDTDGFCQHVAKMWDEIVQQYGESIKFGRINSETQKALIARRIPFNIVILPTIISWVEGEIDIYTLEEEEFQETLKSFIRSKSPKLLKQITLQGYNDLQNDQSLQQNPDLLIIQKGSALNSMLNIVAIKYRNYLNVHNNVKTQTDQIFRQQGKPQVQFPVAIRYTDIKQQQRKQLTLQYSNNVVEKEQMESIIQLTKFLIIPDVYYENYDNFCANLAASNDQLSTLSIFLIKSKFSNKNQLLLEKAHEFIAFKLNEVKERAQQGKSLFETFSTVQFLFVNMDFHVEFKELFSNLVNQFEENMNLENVQAFALQANTRKITFLKNINMMEDWLEDLLEESALIKYHYLTDIMQEEEIKNFLKTQNYSLIKELFKDFYFNLFDKSLALVYLILWYAIVKLEVYLSQQRAFIICLYLYLFTTISLTLLNQQQNILNALK